MKSVRILRVDPHRRTIATMFLKATKDATPQIRKLIRTSNMGSRKLMLVDGAGLVCIAGLDVDESMQGWRVRGGEDTAGIALLTGINDDNGRLIDAPVGRQWLLDRIVWLDGEDVEGRDARAQEMLPGLNQEIRTAIARAFVAPDGDVYLSAEDKAVVGGALVTLGLGTERSGGQLLTKLGETVHDKIVFGVSLAADEARQ